MLNFNNQEEVDQAIEDAMHPCTCKKTLIDLSKSEHPLILLALGRNIMTPTEAILNIWDNKSIEIRRYVARHRNTPEDILRELAADWTEEVRHAVAENPNTPTRLLKILSEESIFFHSRLVSFEVKRALAEREGVE